MAEKVKILEEAIIDKLNDNIIDDIDNKYNKKLSLKLKDGFKYIFEILIIIILIVSFSLTKIKYSNSIRGAIAFLKKCFEGKFLNSNHLKPTNSCKISVVIPVYNCEKTIIPAVRSVQNQDMADIEIILVNDNSKDNTSQIIKKLSEEDSRIRILTNENNKGTLYTRSIGILSSKGEYIMNLDNDDLFMDQTVFDITYKEAIKGNFDIIEFYAYDIPTYNPRISQVTIDSYHNKKEGLIVRKPNLLYFPISYDNVTFYPHDYSVWGRLVKSNLYKKAINNLGFTALGEKRITNFVVWTEDIDITIPLFSYAESLKFIGKDGIFHYISEQTATFQIPADYKIHDEIFLLDIIFDFTEDNEKGKKLVVTRADILKNDRCIYLTKKERNLNLLKAVLKKILNNKYISEDDKHYIIKEYAKCGINTLN